MIADSRWDLTYAEADMTGLVGHDVVEQVMDEARHVEVFSR